MGNIRKNYLYNMAYQVLLVVLPLITAPYVSRVLGPNALGVYSYTNSVAYYFMLVAMLGIMNHGNRSVANVRNDKEQLNHTFCSIFLLQCITFSIALVFYVFYIFALEKDNRLISLIQIIYIVSGMLDISWLYFGLEQFKITVTRNIVIKLATVTLVFLFVHGQNDLWIYAFIMAVGSLLSQACLWVRLSRYVAFVRVKLKDSLIHLKPVLVMFVPVIAFSIYKVMDKIMLGSIAGYEQLGFYNSAEKIINIPMGVISALGVVMLPRAANNISLGKKNEVENGIRLSVKFVTVVSSALAFGLIGVSQVLAPVFFGESFAPCAELIAGMAITVFFISWANVIRTQFLIPCHFDKIYVTSTIFGAVVNLLFNVSFIPQLQALGATIGTVLAEISVMLYQCIAVRKDVPIKRYITSYMPVIFFGMIMSAMVYGIGIKLEKNIITLAIQILVGAVFFCSVTLLWLRHKKDELWYHLCNLKNGIKNE